MTTRVVTNQQTSEIAPFDRYKPGEPTSELKEKESMSNVVSIPNIWNSSVGSYFAFWSVIFCTAKNLVLITKTNMYGTCGEELYAERSSPLSKLQCKHVCFGFFLQEIFVSTFMNNRSFVESH